MTGWSRPILAIVFTLLVGAAPRAVLAADTDSDGIPDGYDNCSDVYNPSQADADSDGYGNACDCDLLPNGAACGYYDAIAFAWCAIYQVFPACEPADMNANGVMDAEDQDLFDEAAADGVPGPSDLSCAGSAGCMLQPPLSFNDAVFENMTSYDIGDLDYLDTCGELYDGVSINDGDTAPSYGAITGGCYDLVRSRVYAREGAWHWGDGNTVRMSWSWIEAEGQSSDHADGVQMYDQGGTGGDLWISNATLRNHDDHSTAALFCSDDWGSGSIHLHNVLFWGGQRGLVLNGDCHVDLYADHVYFVEGTFPEEESEESGCNGSPQCPVYVDTDGVTIRRWDDVHLVTIENGEIVLGDPIAEPE
jgi:hypothetical protein